MIRLAGWRRQRKIARLDFAYFSAVIGMTLQVSDGSVTHAEMRRLALLYGLVTFGFELMDWLFAQPGRQRAGLNHTNRHLAVSGW